MAAARPYRTFEQGRRQYQQSVHLQERELSYQSIVGYEILAGMSDIEP